MARRLIDASFADIDQMCATVRSWDLDFRLLSRPSGAGPVGHLAQSRLGLFDLTYARFWANLEQRGAAPARAITFAVPEVGMRRLWWRGHHTDHQTVLVYTPGSEISCFSSDEFEVHTLSISEEDLGRICEANEIPLSLSQPPGEIFFVSGRDIDRLRRALRSYRDGDPDRGTPAPSALISLLASAWAANGERAQRRPSLRARDRALHKSLELMNAGDLADISAPQLGTYSGVSLRTLEYAFRDRFGMTPAAFLKARRMAAVRDELKRYGPDEEMVTDIMARWGFWHTGQFARDYRQIFGELPSQTLRQRGRLAA